MLKKVFFCKYILPNPNTVSICCSWQQVKTNQPQIVRHHTHARTKKGKSLSLMVNRSSIELILNYKRWIRIVFTISRSLHIITLFNNIKLVLKNRDFLLKQMLYSSSASFFLNLNHEIYLRCVHCFLNRGLNYWKKSQTSKTFFSGYHPLEFIYCLSVEQQIFKALLPGPRRRYIKKRK